MAKVIDKKILSEYYDAVIKNLKTCELRKDDSGYCVGDVLILREWNGTEYTGRRVCVKITYILRNCGFGLQDGYAILFLSVLRGLRNVKKNNKRDLHFNRAYLPFLRSAFRNIRNC